MSNLFNEIMRFVAVFVGFWLLITASVVRGFGLGKAGDAGIFEYLDILESASLPLDVPEIENVRDHVHFQLHTRRTSENGIPLTLSPTDFKKTAFQPQKPVKILIHGYLGQLRDGWMTKAKNALLQNEDSNVILVGWTNITQILLYPWVVEQSYRVAEYVAEMMDFLVEGGTPSKNIHLIGHSIGAHIAGVASKDASSGIVGRITGLDAAYPLYKGLREFDKLDKSDAFFVDCIHTSSGLLGIPEPFCHADFYPNGGTLYQPGCDALTLVICSHRRSHDYFVESIDASSKFKAFTCSSSFHNLLDCVDEGALMGYPCTQEHKGVFYVRTGVQPPYSQAELDFTNSLQHRKYSKRKIFKKRTN